MNEKKNNEERLYTTLDAYRAGFLTLRGHTIAYAITVSDKVIFGFPLTDQLLHDINDYENGAMVDAFRFSLAVKQVKTQVHSLRAERRY